MSAGPDERTRPGLPAVVKKPEPPTHTDLDLIPRYGKYFLVRKLAEGGMAEIFLAKHRGPQGFERNVVVKRMLKQFSEDVGFVSMFLDEARLAAQLSHPNIVQIHDLGLVDGCYFICMEYLAGEDFSSILRSASRRREYVPFPIILRTVADAAHGLHFAHEFADAGGNPLNIVHRDISPSNIFVSFEGQVKVLDFGIARAESRTTRTTAGVVKGKYLYMAPEQARGLAVDRRADVFSLGVCLYEAVTYIRPFSRDNDLAILNAVLQGDFPPPRKVRPDLPIELQEIILKAMATRAEDRYPTAAALAADLEKYLAATASTAGLSQLSAYLRGAFGDGRVTLKTRIPSLDELIASGRTVQGFTDPEFRTEVGTGVPVSRSDATRSSEVFPTDAARKARTRWMVGAAVAGLVAAGGIGAVLGFGIDRDAPSKNPIQPPVAVVTPPPETRVPPEAAVATAEPKTEVMPAEGSAEKSKVVPVKKPPAVKKRDKLTAIEIQKVVSRNSATLQQCFQSHKSELPDSAGQVVVQFVIQSSGRVTSATVDGPLAKAQVGTCLVQRVSRFRFPSYESDKDTLINVPFAYSVR